MGILGYSINPVNHLVDFAIQWFIVIFSLFPLDITYNQLLDDHT